MGIDAANAALEFASQLKIDPSICFGDDGWVVGDALGLGKGFSMMWNPPVATALMARNDQESLTAVGEAFKGEADTIGIKWLAPAQIRDTLRRAGGGSWESASVGAFWCEGGG